MNVAGDDTQDRKDVERSLRRHARSKGREDVVVGCHDTQGRRMSRRHATDGRKESCWEGYWDGTPYQMTEEETLSRGNRSKDCEQDCIDRIVAH